MSIQLDLTSDGKKVKINGKPTRDSQALAEKVSIVSFVPEDLGAVLGGAALRRRLLDQASASLSPNYVLYYRQYDRVLTQRNRLLKQPLVDLKELESFTEVLSGVASELERLRLEALNIMRPYFDKAMAQLSHGQLFGTLTYVPTSGGDLKSAVVKVLSEERARKTTLRGPHLDDLDIDLNGHPARFTASRGQARLIVLAFKIAQLQAVDAKRGLKPILLLDDIVGELDPHHAARLLETVTHLGAQTLVTTTHLSMLPNDWKPAHVFEVQQGSIKPVSDLVPL
jgi:DNA replication and repair protein RecF